MRLADAMFSGAAQERDLIPFFDSAYQGFASGDLEQDGVSEHCHISFSLVPPAP